jgi:hypothetical protein
MRMHGVLKVMFVALTANECLTSAFIYAAKQIDPDVSPMVVTLFSFATCGLLGTWLQSDARRAYLMARDKGYLDGLDKAKEAAQVPANCPRRWLVVLYTQLNPAVVGL